jgi:hypothetical protein
MRSATPTGCLNREANYSSWRVLQSKINTTSALIWASTTVRIITLRLMRRHAERDDYSGDRMF